MVRRLEQYRDRWSSYGLNTGIAEISNKLSASALRELELFASYDDAFLERISPDVSIAVWKEGAVLFEEGSYIDVGFFLLDGEVTISLEGVAAPQPIFDTSRTMVFKTPENAAGTVLQSATGGVRMAREIQRTGEHQITFLATMDFDLPRGETATLQAGDVFGEIGALSGWPQSVTAKVSKQCRLIQIRVPALRLMKRKTPAFKKRLDALYRERSLFQQLKSTPIFSRCSDMMIEGLKEMVELESYGPGESIAEQGEPMDAAFLVRSGFVKLSQRLGQGDIAVSYLSKGQLLGEVELLIDGIEHWEISATSVEHCELIKVPVEVLESILRDWPQIEQELWKSVVARVKEIGSRRRHIGKAEFTQVALETGLVQGSSMLVIDLDLCTRCDDCVKACAETHEGRPRFVREGDKLDNLLVAKSCYHCRDPVCLIGCPTGAIHRAGIADVVAIEDEICIGCSTCANNCPYDAIVMHDTEEIWSADMVPVGLRGRDRRVASKCDLCHESPHGPACVESCPQGCAFRVGSLEEIQALTGE